MNFKCPFNTFAYYLHFATTQLTEIVIGV